jgi:hypothetical protein
MVARSQESKLPIRKRESSHWRPRTVDFIQDFEVVWPRGVNSTGTAYSSLTVFLDSPEEVNRVGQLRGGFIDGGEGKSAE